MFYLRKVLFLIGLLCLSLNLTLIYLKFDEININDEKFLQTNKCPYCFGVDLCPEFLNSNSSYYNKYFLSFNQEKSLLSNTYSVQRILNIKNVWYGRDDFHNRELVFKKLAHDQELEKFDFIEQKCIRFNDSKCENSISSNMKKFSLHHKMNYEIFNSISRKLNIQCSECLSERIVEMIYNLSLTGRLYEKNLMLLTTLKINCEPIVLQLFRGEDGWPFPEYYGACGRVIVETNEGLTLNYYLNESFKLRAKIARKLLEELIKLSENKLELAVYLFDLGFENIAYNSNKNKIYFIDAEDSLIVDKLKIRTDNHNWNSTNYFMKYDDCDGKGDCLLIESTKLCTSYHTDLNIYSACRHILSSYARDGSFGTNLLHSIPNELDSIYNLNNLLNECAINDNTSRLHTARKLVNVLEKTENY